MAERDMNTYMNTYMNFSDLVFTIKLTWSDGTQQKVYTTCTGYDNTGHVLSATFEDYLDNPKCTWGAEMHSGMFCLGNIADVSMESVTTGFRVRVCLRPGAGGVYARMYNQMRAQLSR